MGGSVVAEGRVTDILKSWILLPEYSYQSTFKIIRNIIQTYELKSFSPEKESIKAVFLQTCIPVIFLYSPEVDHKSKLKMSLKT